MMCLVTEYLNINRILLLAIGIWPYQQSKLVQFQITLCDGVFISIIVFQIIAFLTTEITPAFVIDVLSQTFFFSLYVMCYNVFYFKNRSVRHTLEQIQYIYNELKNENEIAIIENYGYEGKRYTIVFTLFGICCLVIVIVQPWYLQILNIFLLVNESQPYRPIYIITEYFVDKEKYFHLISLHISVVFTLGTIVILATGTMLIACAKWICGIFRLASYRIEHAMQINIAQTVDLTKDILIYNKIIHAVDMHCKAITLTKFLITNFEILFLSIILCAIICLSLNLYEIMSFGGSVEELMLHLVFVSVIVMYIFVANYFAQEILDHNNHIFVTVYNTRWYKTPLHIQRMILFLLQKGTKNISLSVGGLFAASLEGSATLLSTSISYFTVLCSTRH